MKAFLVAMIAGVLSLVSPSFAATHAPVQVAQAKAELIDINRATAEQLMKLHGIGEVRAAAIIKGRPYARKDELAKKGVIPESVYEQIKEQIIARQ